MDKNGLLVWYRIKSGWS